MSFYPSILKMPGATNLGAFGPLILCCKSGWVSIFPSASLELSLFGSANPLQAISPSSNCFLTYASCSYGFVSFVKMSLLSFYEGFFFFFLAFLELMLAMQSL
jgi:hypothetical protein